MMDNQEPVTSEANTDLPPMYSNVDQEPPSYEDVCLSSGNSNATPPSYIDTLPPDHISPLPIVPADTASLETGPPVVTQNSGTQGSDRTPAHNGSTEYPPHSGIPLDPIPASSITGQSAFRRAHQQRMAAHRQADLNQYIATTTRSSEPPSGKPETPWIWIMAALFFCFPMGLVALICSIKAENDYKAGRLEEARKAATISNWCSPVGCGLGCGWCVGLLLPACIVLPLIFFA